MSRGNKNKKVFFQFLSSFLRYVSRGQDLIMQQEAVKDDDSYTPLLRAATHEHSRSGGRSKNAQITSYQKISFAFGHALNDYQGEFLSF